MATYDLLPVATYANHGWVPVEASSIWSAWASEDEDSYARNPSHKGSATVSMEQDPAALQGKLITSVTVFVTCNKVTSATTSLTMNLIPRDDNCRYFSRTIYPRSNIKTFEMGTFKNDANGKAWTINRLNKILLRLFSYSGVADRVRVYSVKCVVNFKADPTVQLFSPTGTVQTPSPLIEWLYNHVDGDPQTRAEYKIFTQSTTQEAGFNVNDDDEEPVFSDVMTGHMADLNQVTLPFTLPIGDYKIFFRVFSNIGASSDWVNKSFGVQAPAPGAPSDDGTIDPFSGESGVGSVTAVSNNYESSVALVMRDTSNLLSVQQADFETTTDVLGYTTTNCTAVRDTSVSYGDSSVASMKLTASSAATMSVESTPVRVAEGTPITVMSQVRADSTARTVNVTARFYDSDHNLLASEVLASDANVVDSWTNFSESGTTPKGSVGTEEGADATSGAAWSTVKIEIEDPADGEVHYVDHVGLSYGPDARWNDGGHFSRNLLTSHESTADDPADNGWTFDGNGTAVTVENTSGTGAHGSKAFQMEYTGVSPNISFVATGATFTSTSLGTEYTLNKPAGILDGDLLIAFVSGTSRGGITPPDGWDLVNTASTTSSASTEDNQALHVLKRNALEVDPATWVGDIEINTTRRRAFVVAYRGTAPAEDQFVNDGVRVDTTGQLTHATATVNNNISNSWRIAAFSARDDQDGSWTANEDSPTEAPPIQFVGTGAFWANNSSSYKGNYAINRPSGVQSGDLLVAILSIPSSDKTVTPPTGWTTVRKFFRSGSTALKSMVFVVFKKTAESSDPSSWSSSFTGQTQNPVTTRCVAYRNAAPAANQFIDEGSTGRTSSNSISTTSVSNDNDRSWIISAFTGNASSSTTWTSTGHTERADSQSSNFVGPTYTSHAIYDSNGSVPTGSQSWTANSSTSWWSAVSWIGVIRPAFDEPPPQGGAETKRSDSTVGGSDPRLTTSVHDSGGVAPTGDNKLFGTYTPSSGLSCNSVTSWIGIIRPAGAEAAGSATAKLTDLIDIENVDPRVLAFAHNKVTVGSAFKGSTSGSPILRMQYFRATELLSQDTEQGSSFGTSGFTDSFVTFDLPEGTTHLRPFVGALNREIGDTVQFDRVTVAFGDDHIWREGTGRDEHSLWTIPEIQYREDAGHGYGDWRELPPLPEVDEAYPRFDHLSGSLIYVDHTIKPLVRRRYRVRTVSYGLAGDKFASPYGLESNEAQVIAEHWWLKNIDDASMSMILKVRAEPTAIGTTNTAAVFQPLGEDFPIVVTEGYKANSISITVIVDQLEFSQLNDLLKCNCPLLLQSDIDDAWWVKPVGDLQTETQVTHNRKEHPLRFVNITFTEVAPPDGRGKTHSGGHSHPA